MSCYNGNCYLPQPPRAWSRVQNSCSLITNPDNNSIVRDPYTGELIPPSVLGARIAMLNKGNILQYKANSSNLTKSQRYSKIATGQWVNRNTTWATQSTRGYTNPNTTSLKRDGNINIAIDPITGAIIGQTLDPPTCLKPINPVYPVLPSNGGGGSDVKDPDIPPPVDPTPGSDVFPPIIPVTPTEPIIIQDGGNLICSVQENICTGETKRSLSQKLCNPTTDSDVPGPIQDLCWNDGTQTWYPRQRYIMTNSTNKWPVNAELFSSIIIDTPVIISIVANRNIVTLTWSLGQCLPATSFNIYQDGNLIKVVDGNIFTTNIMVDYCNTYQYYIVAENITATQISNVSNIVSIYIYYFAPPTNLTEVSKKLTSIDFGSGSGTIQISWNPPLNYCSNIDGYNIYINDILVGSVIAPITTYTTNDIQINQTYDFNVTTLTTIGTNQFESDFSSTLTVNLPPIYTTTGMPITTYPSSGSIMLKYLNDGIFNFNYDLLMEYTLVGGGGGGGYWFFSVGSSAGGGGQVLNTFSPRILSPNNFTLKIGKGGIRGTSGSFGNGEIGKDTSISGTSFFVSTKNSIYSGQGGIGSLNYSYNGGGGHGGNITSANGGSYNTTYGNGSGGGGGSLTLVDSNNTIVSVIVGGVGQNTQQTSGGGGGSGNQGIDSNYYGGGGGGGANPFPQTNIGGTGGAGGGGNGAYNNAPSGTPSENGEPNTGGGGGGGCNNVTPGLIPGDGGDGVIIIKFTTPP